MALNNSNRSFASGNESLPMNFFMDLPDVSVEDKVSFILFSILFLGGLLGNSGITYTIIRRKKMRTTTNWLILNLTLSCLFIILVTIPLINILRYIDWPFGAVGCKYLVMPPMECFAGVCVLTHTAIALVRYYIITHSMTHTFTPMVIVIIIITIWTIPFLIQSVSIMGILGEGIVIAGKYCELFFKFNGARMIYHTLVFFLTYVFPMIATAFAYVRIHLEVRRSIKQVHGHVDLTMLTYRDRQSRKMDRILMIMYIFFACSTLPIQLLHFVEAVGVNMADAHIYFMFLLALFYMQVLVNPLILSCVSDEFRQEFCRLFRCKAGSKHSRQVTKDTTLTTKHRQMSLHQLQVKNEGNVEGKEKGLSRRRRKFTNESLEYRNICDSNTSFFDARSSYQDVSQQRYECKNYCAKVDSKIKIFEAEKCITRSCSFIEKGFIDCKTTVDINMSCSGRHQIQDRANTVYKAEYDTEYNARYDRSDEVCNPLISKRSGQIKGAGKVNEKLYQMTLPQSFSFTSMSQSEERLSNAVLSKSEGNIENSLIEIDHESVML